MLEHGADGGPLEKKLVRLKNVDGSRKKTTSTSFVNQDWTEKFRAQMTSAPVQYVKQLGHPSTRHRDVWCIWRGQEKGSTGHRVPGGRVWCDQEGMIFHIFCTETGSTLSDVKVLGSIN